MIESPVQRPPHRQQGFGLIEVLVALTILSIGMLGLAAMQLTSLQFARESLDTTIATIMVRDMNERAWAQRGEACKKLKGPEGLLSKWQGDATKNAPMPNVEAKASPFPDDPDTNKQEYGRYYTLTVEWGSEDDNTVELVTFLPCEGA